MSDDAQAKERLFSKADRYWAQLGEFVENRNEIVDYLLRRTKIEHGHFKSAEKWVDFNEFYKVRFSQFIVASYKFIIDKLLHSPSSRCIFVPPTNTESLEQILAESDFNKSVEERWDFIPDVPEKYIESINTLIQNLKHIKEWRKDIYVSETIVRRYVGANDDGFAYHTEKKIMEIYYRHYPAANVRIIAEKNFPNGPFAAYVDLIDEDEKVTRIIQIDFSLESSIDKFVRGQKKMLDEQYRGG